MAFLDKVKEGFGAAAATVTVRSKEALDSVKLKAQIANLQKQKTEAIEELGSITYTMFVKGARDEERIRAKCEAIAALDQQIKQKEEELAQVHASAQHALGHGQPVATCECGAEVPAGAKFCGSCGKKMAAADQA